MGEISTLYLYPPAREPGQERDEALAALQALAEELHLRQLVPLESGYVEIPVGKARLAEALEVAVPGWQRAGLFFPP